MIFCSGDRAPLSSSATLIAEIAALSPGEFVKAIAGANPRNWSIRMLVSRSELKTYASNLFAIHLSRNRCPSIFLPPLRELCAGFRQSIFFYMLIDRLADNLAALFLCRAAECSERLMLILRQIDLRALHRHGHIYVDIYIMSNKSRPQRGW